MQCNYSGSNNLAQKMAAAEDRAVIQLIDGDGDLDASAVETFVRSIRLNECGLSYAVVSIMGPQSSGKSTLLNHLFHTTFREMDALEGRSQTTKGVWLANCVGIEPCTIAMDLEGTDGRERGEDDTTFEKQSALFALAVSDVVLINMWCHDIGREQAANKPLLKTVFQVMLPLFSPRKTTLMFVIRDKTRTPLEILEPILIDDVQNIWNAIRKPEELKDAALNDFFTIEVVGLSSYEEKEEEFEEQVANLRKRFFNSIAPGGLAGDRRGVVPASGFSFSLQEIWKTIKGNKELDLPAHKVMVATVRCEEVANEKFASLSSDEHWLEFGEAAQTSFVPGFGKKLGSILNSCLSSYDIETIYFDDDVRKRKREQLESKLLQLVYPAYMSVLGHLLSNTLNNFKVALEKALDSGQGFAAAAHDCSQSYMFAFDEKCADVAVEQANWDSSKVREELDHEIRAHINSVRSAKLAELHAFYMDQLKKALEEPVVSLLVSADDNTWPAIRKLLDHETKLAAASLSSALTAFDIHQATENEMLTDLRNYARKIVESKAKEEAGRVLIHIKERFSTIFSHDADSMPRIWTQKDNVKEITKTARLASLKLLSILSAVRLEEKADNIECTLSLSLLDNPKSSTTDRSISSLDQLVSGSWEEVPSSATLLTPVQCKSLWRQFNVETEYIISQAIAAKEANRLKNNQLPSAWVIALIAALGFNEFMYLLRRPWYVAILFVVYLLGKALWVQLDISHDLENGVLPGLISLVTKIVPVVTKILKRLADLGQQPAAPASG